MDLGALIRQLQGAMGGNRVIRGIVTSGGDVTSGTGFTSSKTATGAYTVEFDTEFSGIPAFTIAGFGSAGRVATITAHAADAVSVRIADTSNSATDTAFHFIAVGPV